jgi:cell division protein FtsQ
MKRGFVLAAFTIGAALLVWGGIALMQAPILRITQVTVEGASRLSDQQVIDLAAIPKDATVLRLPTARIVESIERSPWVSKVTVTRTFPTGVSIVIEERAPAAVVDARGSELWLVDSSGVWLGERSAEDDGLVTIRGVSSLKPVAGRRSDAPELTNAIRVARGLSDELKALTRAISAPSIERTAIITEDDIEIFVGEAERIADKDRIAREILDREKGKVVYINVRVVERPTWRGLE